MNVLGTLATYVMGVVLREFRESGVEQRDQEQLGHLSEAERQAFLAGHVERLRATGRFPHFLRIFDEGIDPDAARTRDERFEFGLECLLDGIAARLPGGGPGQRPEAGQDSWPARKAVTARSDRPARPAGRRPPAAARAARRPRSRAPRRLAGARPWAVCGAREGDVTLAVGGYL